MEAEGEDTGGESDDDYDDNTTEEEEEVVEEGNIVNKDDFSVIVKADSGTNIIILPYYLFISWFYYW